MPEKISIVKDGGESLSSNIVSVFMIPDLNKKYIITTENAVDPHGLTVLHVSEISGDSLVKVATDEEWSTIKTVMRAIISGSVGNYQYIPSFETINAAGQYSRDISVSAPASKQMIDSYASGEKVEPVMEEADEVLDNTMDSDSIFPTAPLATSEDEVVPGISIDESVDAVTIENTPEAPEIDPSVQGAKPLDPATLPVQEPVPVPVAVPEPAPQSVEAPVPVPVPAPVIDANATEADATATDGEVSGGAAPAPVIEEAPAPEAPTPEATPVVVPPVAAVPEAPIEEPVPQETPEVPAPEAIPDTPAPIIVDLDTPPVETSEEKPEDTSSSSSVDFDIKPIEIPPAKNVPTAPAPVAAPAEEVLGAEMVPTATPAVNPTTPVAEVVGGGLPTPDTIVADVEAVSPMPESIMNEPASVPATQNSAAIAVPADPNAVEVNNATAADSVAPEIDALAATPIIVDAAPAVDPVVKEEVPQVLDITVANVTEGVVDVLAPAPDSAVVTVPEAVEAPVAAPAPVEEPVAVEASAEAPAVPEIPVIGQVGTPVVNNVSNQMPQQSVVVNQNTVMPQTSAMKKLGITLDFGVQPNMDTNATLDEIVAGAQELFIEGVRNLVLVMTDKLYKDLREREEDLKKREVIVRQREQAINDSTMAMMNGDSYPQQPMMNQMMMGQPMMGMQQPMMGMQQPMMNQQMMAMPQQQVMGQPMVAQQPVMTQPMNPTGVPNNQGNGQV